MNRKSPCTPRSMHASVHQLTKSPHRTSGQAPRRSSCQEWMHTEVCVCVSGLISTSDVLILSVLQRHAGAH